MTFFVIELDCGVPFAGCRVRGPFYTREEAVEAGEALQADYTIATGAGEDEDQ